MTLTNITPLSHEIRILCMYCSKLKIITKLVIWAHSELPLNSFATNINQELTTKNLNQNSIIIDGLDYAYSIKEIRAKSTCYQYPDRFYNDHQVCAMVLLSGRYIFSVSGFQHSSHSFLITSGVTVTSNNFQAYKVWLPYYVAESEFAFMSASLHTNISLNNVYFEPLN